jgi:hypothetical protein
MALEFTTSYLEDSIAVLRYYKKLGERAMAQVADERMRMTNYTVRECGVGF